MLCLSEESETAIKGAPLGDVYQFVDIHLVQCVNSLSQSCKSQSVIDAYFADLRLNVLYLNQLIDFKDFNEPV